MTPAELAEELDRCGTDARHLGSRAPMFTIHPDQMPLLAAALRLAEAVNIDHFPDCERALAAYRAAREGLANAAP